MNFEGIILNTIDGIATADYNLLGTILLIIAIIFWLVVISWIWVDSGERTTSTWMRIFYTFMGILPIFGWVIYLIVRPTETIDEIYWGDLERRYLKYETSELGDCPKCGNELFPGYIFCPDCKYEIKRKCPQCGVYMDVNHKYCTNCGYQLKTRIQKEEVLDTEVMQQKIEETKEEAHESVKAKKSKYKVELNFVSHLGESIIKGYKLLGEKVKTVFVKKGETKIVDVQEAKEEPRQNVNTQPNQNQKKSKKKNKKKKRK